MEKCIQGLESANKRKLNGSSDDVETKIRKLGVVTGAAGDAQPPRRSSRVKQSKNSSKPFTVSSSMTLHELKMKVQMLYSVLRFSYKCVDLPRLNVHFPWI